MFNSFIHSLIPLCTEWLLGVQWQSVVKGRIGKEVKAF